jgi:imidazolonepropionase-like amidohydrolase
MLRTSSDCLGDSFEEGKFADLIAVCDPTVDIANMEKVVFVMKAGEVIKNMRSLTKE